MLRPGRSTFSGTSQGRPSSTGRSTDGTLSRFSREVGPWLYVAALVCLMGIVAAVYLGQTTYVAKQAQEMEDLEKQLREARWDNNDLLLQIAEHQDSSRIEEEAAALGLAPAQQFQYVEVMVEGLASPTGEGAAGGSSAGAVLSEHLPDWLGQMLQQFAAWTAGPVVRAEQVSE